MAIFYAKLYSVGLRKVKGMKTLTYFWVIGSLCLLANTSYAGNKFPVDASGEVVYKHSFNLQAGIKDDDAYGIVQDWFNSAAAKFTCQNTEGPAGNCKNRALVEDAFKNHQPLQSLDPSSGRMVGRGLIKYYGAATSSVGVLYMEYYVVLEISGHQLTATVSKMKYHHFNQRTYAPKPIYGWQGGKPLDDADKLGTLMSNANENRDLAEVGAFVNKNMDALFNNLQSFMQTAKLLEPARLNQASITEE